MALPTRVGITTRTANQSNSNEICAEASAASNNASIDSERCVKQVIIVRLKKAAMKITATMVTMVIVVCPKPLEPQTFIRKPLTEGLKNSNRVLGSIVLNPKP